MTYFRPPKRLLTQEYIAAPRQVLVAIASGKLPKLDGSVPCQDCGSPAEHYDHRDYKNPLDVAPVCRTCNFRRGTGRNKFKSNAHRLEWEEEKIRIRNERMAHAERKKHGRSLSEARLKELGLWESTKEKKRLALLRQDIHPEDHIAETE